VTTVLPSRAETGEVSRPLLESTVLPVYPPLSADEEPIRRTLRTRPADDLRNLIGSGVASLATVWLLYYRVLPFSGIVGFLICWFTAFVAFYAGSTYFTTPGPAVKDRAATAVVHLGPALVAASLIAAIVYVFYRGWPALHHWNFYTQDEAGVGPLTPLNKGGVLHAVVGTFIEIGIAVAITLPLGVGTAVYMTEVGGRLSRVVRIVVEAMTALPSIVAGLFIYVVWLLALGNEKTGFAGSLAISVMMLPIVARASDVVLRVVPGGLREASLALGSTRWRTVWRVILPTARPGLATALILAVARGVGETSPVLLASSPSTFLNVNPFKDPMNSLPLFIFGHVRSGETYYVARGYGAASVLLVLVLIFFALTRLLARRGSGS
jgi:phosphate transport system permease protein